MSRIITCKNTDGLELRFGYGYTPWLLTDVDGIYLSEGNVYTSDNTMIDGATYQGTTLKLRNIVMTMIDRVGHRYNRQILYDVFKPKSPGTFVYEEGGEIRTIQYYVESVDISSMGARRTATVSLICPDPYFQANNETSVLIAGWAARWEFPHQFVIGGEAMGERSGEKLKTITNDTASDNIGMTISIVSAGNASNPSITCVETQQTIKVGTVAHPLQLKAGDEVQITTGTNDKHVYLISGGKKKEINEYLDEESEFIQLMRGDNTIGYGSDTGSEHLTVTCTFRYKYLGV